MTTTTQDTSVEALRLERELGTLAERQARVYRWLLEHGPATSGEVLHPRVDNVNLWRARFTELADLGAIAEVSRRPCAFTGRRAIVWKAMPWPWTPRPKPADPATVYHRALLAALEAMHASDDPKTKAEADRIERVLDLEPGKAPTP